ncbi:glycosyltransferase [Streptomyces sp. NPDC005803]|uniref:glycosyltransferase n=1 Tax=Streptomyces sp. NPDC005803 TaxID=3154297 RepID=UPI0033F2BFFB
MGGVVSATQNLAGALAEKHDVEIVCLRKSRDESYFPLDPRVSVRVLTDLRPHSPVSDLDNPLIDQFPKVYVYPPTEKKPWISRLAELRLLEFLATTDSDVVVSSNPRISIMLAYGRSDYLRVIQEHSMPAIYAEWEKKPLFKAYLSMDAVCALTPEEVESLAKQVPGARNRLAVMPNCVPAAPVVSDGAGKVVIAAGLLKENKNFAALIEAFATVVRKRPDWKLRIYGEGSEKANLRKRIEELGLYNDVLLMGPAAPVTPEFSKGSLFVLPSKREAFGNVIVEAMAAGLPVVSTDAKYGPRNILTHGEDGLIVPVGDTDAMAEAILELIEDDDRRKRMSAAAVRNAVRFHEQASRERFEAILHDALARKALPAEATAVMDSRGSVRIDVGELPAQAGGITVVCRRPGRTEVEECFPVSAEGTAVVAWNGALPEGTWELSLRSADGHEVPLHVDGYGCDVRELPHVPLPREGERAMELLLPHRHVDGRLRIRSVVRESHVEVGELKAGAERFELRTRYWGGEIGPGARLELVQRKDKTNVLSVPVQTGADFLVTASVDFGTLVAKHEGKEEIWDAWLRPGADAARVPLSKLATDVLQPINVFTFPRPRVRIAPDSKNSLPARVGRRAARIRKGGTDVPKPVTMVEIRPYFTSDAQLAFKTVGQ